MVSHGPGGGGRASDPFLTDAWSSDQCAVMGAARVTGTPAMIEEKSRKRRGEKIGEETH